MLNRCCYKKGLPVTDDLSLQCRNAELPIGVFDSGVGGLTVVRAIREELPHEDLVYLGDTARTPYGTKSPSTIVRFSCEDVQFLQEHHVKAVIIGCSTVSAWALPVLKKKFSVPIFDVILPGVLSALEKTRNQRIGVIGTNATVRSLTYTHTIMANCQSAKVFEAGCRLLVPLVEEGWIDHRATRLILREYLAPLRRRRIDTLLLACTHFPLLKEAIAEVVGEKIALVDCAQMAAKFARERLEKLGLLCRKRRRPGVFQAFVTDEPERFTKLARRFLPEHIESALEIDLAPL
jgi:glutamate racemase